MNTTVVIPESVYIGYIIGYGGRTIRSIEDATNTEIKWPYKLNPADGKFTIYGFGRDAATDVEEAVDEILQLVNGRLASMDMPPLEKAQLVLSPARDSTASALVYPRVVLRGEDLSDVRYPLWASHYSLSECARYVYVVGKNAQGRGTITAWDLHRGTVSEYQHNVDLVRHFYEINRQVGLAALEATSEINLVLCIGHFYSCPSPLERAKGENGNEASMVWNARFGDHPELSVAFQELRRLEVDVIVIDSFTKSSDSYPLRQYPFAERKVILQLVSVGSDHANASLVHVDAEESARRFGTQPSLDQVQMLAEGKRLSNELMTEVA